MNSNTHAPKLSRLSDDVINQIKDFPKYYVWLTLEQRSLIDELIPNEELRERYKNHGLCKECSLNQNRHEKAIKVDSPAAFSITNSLTDPS